MNRAQKDRNFDDLGERLQQRIYDSPKGVLRLRVLAADFATHLPELQQHPQQLLDSGCGGGHFALMLAQQGHHPLLNDLSAEMLTTTRERFRQAGIEGAFLHAPIQQLPERLPGKFPLILNHAVLEWCAEPQAIITTLSSLLAPGGVLSLLFYNLHGIRLRNLVRGNLNKVKRGDFRGEPGGLTPHHALDPQQVQQWLRRAGLEIFARSGVRIFYDLMERSTQQRLPLEEIIEHELALRHLPPYCDMGRYVHLLCRKVGENPHAATTTV